jgi:YidC/Oxa1 family membrane protein insertase
LLDWMYTAIAWVMKQWHALFSTFLDPGSGITWALSIVFLVVTIRVLLFRLFVKQVKSQRAMQEIQPEIQKLRKQYGSDKQGFSQAMMALQKERGVNPLAGCLPLLPQIPVFIALFHVLRRLAPGKEGLYSWDNELTTQAASAKLFGAPISSSFKMDGAKERLILPLTDGSYTNIRIVAFALIVIMCATTFFTQKQIQKRSGPVEGQAAMVQKLLLYGLLLPDRRAALLVHQQPVDPGPAVLHPQEAAPARIAGRAGEGRRRQAGRRPEDARAQARRQAGAPEARPSGHRCPDLDRGCRRLDRRGPAGRHDAR